MYLYPNILLQLALNKESGKEVERWQGCTNPKCLGDLNCVQWCLIFEYINCSYVRTYKNVYWFACAKQKALDHFEVHRSFPEMWVLGMEIASCQPSGT
jgi:hypothetical protein